MEAESSLIKVEQQHYDYEDFVLENYACSPKTGQQTTEMGHGSIETTQYHTGRYVTGEMWGLWWEKVPRLRHV
jgi:hypothetical protein